MMKEAEANKEEDKKRKEEADVKNEAEQLVFQTEKSSREGIPRGLLCAQSWLFLKNALTGSASARFIKVRLKPPV